VILDLTVPGGMGGYESLKQLLAIDPQVKAIVSSGYFHDPVIANYRAHGFQGVVSKPYTIEELNDTLYKPIYLDS
jgi:CheY-like chemotaxis protein